MSKLFLIRFALFGVAMWFFGNLYEGIVLAPNQLVDTIRKLEIWNDYFTLTNPIFYFVPITHIAVIVIWVLVFSKGINMESRRSLKRAAALLFAAEIVTIYIVLQLNLNLFFSDQFDQDAINKVIQWNILNATRVILVGISLGLIFKGQNKLLLEKKASIA